VVEAYRLYVNRRLLDEPVFFQAALDYLASEQGYKNIPFGLVIWLATKDPDTKEPLEVGYGYRKVSYAVLQKIYPSIPNYDADASAEIRSKQYEKVVAFLEEHEKEKPSLPNDPFSN